MSSNENEIRDRVILNDGEPPSSPATGMFFAFVDKLLKTKDSGGNIATYAKIESGSDATNGDWWKLYLTEYTGILLCIKNGFSVDTVDADRLNSTWTFPQSFSAEPYAQPQLHNLMRDAGVGSAETGVVECDNAGLTSTNQTRVVIYRVSGMTDFTTGDSQTVNLFAIGTFDDTP